MLPQPDRRRSFIAEAGFGRHPRANRNCVQLATRLCERLRDDPHRRVGLHVCAGGCANAQVAQALGLATVAPESLHPR